MFDTTTEIELGMRLESGGSSVTVRFPSDAEWAVRAKARKVIVRRLGRGVSETLPPEPSEADVELYHKIALNGQPTLTKREAFQVAEILGACSATNVTVEGDVATVELSVMGGTVNHTLKVPTTDKAVALKRAGFRILELPYSHQSIQIAAEPGAELWDACGGSSKDYAGAIPAIHKDTAARALVDYLERNLGPRAGDTSF